jgi:hypothetical protein
MASTSRAGNLDAARRQPSLQLVGRPDNRDIDIDALGVRLAYPGLFVIGLTFLRRRRSSFIDAWSSAVNRAINASYVSSWHYPDSTQLTG